MTSRWSGTAWETARSILIPNVGFLLDTNVLSEVQKSRPNQNVLGFLSRIGPLRSFISVLSFGELRKGVASRGRYDARAADSLSRWVDRLEVDHASRVLGVNQEIARIWGEISSDRTRPAIDTLLAATAIHHRLTFVTRNLRDVEDLPVISVDPWETG